MNRRPEQARTTVQTARARARDLPHVDRGLAGRYRPQVRVAAGLAERRSFIWPFRPTAKADQRQLRPSGTLFAPVWVQSHQQGNTGTLVHRAPCRQHPAPQLASRSRLPAHAHTFRRNVDRGIAGRYRAQVRVETRVAERRSSIWPFRPTAKADQRQLRPSGTLFAFVWVQSHQQGNTGTLVHPHPAPASASAPPSASSNRVAPPVGHS
ncbi:hypothetical protein [Alicyclobacillus dauci]|uniref:Uncharacterized protein n=1 Tax=Alicyclobacillus dauci TaxID=1475485 RepID=A0ABY6Z1D2_9BACL|nr:hypothetical protein [Alicyclobacillus dauci]WAH36690.1 hypothetical protein NZD86_21355 [Alicyclobacillus dauci]